MMIILGWNKKFLQRGLRYTPGYDPTQQIWDRDRKIPRDNFGWKIKWTRFIYLPGSKICEAEGHFKIRSCLQYSVINSAPMI